MKKIVEIKNLTKSYGKSRGIENIDLQIEKGTIYGFIGPNGAGKSTTIKCIMSLINKNSGEIFINGEPVTKKNYKIKEKIGYLPSEIHLYEDMKVKDVFKYSESFYSKDCSKRTYELAKKLDLDINKKIDELSLGNLKKVGIIVSLMHRPEILIMDEATSGLDPLMQEAFYDILLKEKEKGTTVFFSSHILSEIKRICDKVAVIKEGKVIKIDEIDNITSAQAVKISLISKDINNILREIKAQALTVTENKAEFIYKEDISDLISALSKYKLEKLLIEEPAIEEIFMHYYQ